MIKGWLKEIEEREERTLASALAKGRKAAAARARHNLKQARAGLTCLEASRERLIGKNRNDGRGAEKSESPGENEGEAEDGDSSMLTFWCVALLLFVAVEYVVLTHCWVW